MLTGFFDLSSNLFCGALPPEVLALEARVVTGWGLEAGNSFGTPCPGGGGGLLTPTPDPVLASPTRAPHAVADDIWDDNEAPGGKAGGGSGADPFTEPLPPPAHIKAAGAIVALVVGAGALIAAGRLAFLLCWVDRPWERMRKEEEAARLAYLGATDPALAARLRAANARAEKANASGGSGSGGLCFSGGGGSGPVPFGGGAAETALGFGRRCAARLVGGKVKGGGDWDDDGGDDDEGSGGGGSSSGRGRAGGAVRGFLLVAGAVLALPFALVWALLLGALRALCWLDRRLGHCAVGILVCVFRVRRRCRRSARREAKGRAAPLALLDALEPEDSGNSDSDLDELDPEVFGGEPERKRKKKRKGKVRGGLASGGAHGDSDSCDGDGDGSSDESSDDGSALSAASEEMDYSTTAEGLLLLTVNPKKKAAREAAKAKEAAKKAKKAVRWAGVGGDDDLNPIAEDSSDSSGSGGEIGGLRSRASGSGESSRMLGGGASKAQTGSRRGGRLRAGLGGFVRRLTGSSGPNVSGMWGGGGGSGDGRDGASGSGGGGGGGGIFGSRARPTGEPPTARKKALLAMELGVAPPPAGEEDGNQLPPAQETPKPRAKYNFSERRALGGQGAGYPKGTGLLAGFGAELAPRSGL